jgi:hypothetical protein
VRRPVRANALDRGFAIESDGPRIRSYDSVQVDTFGQPLERAAFEGLELGKLNLGLLRDLLTRQPSLLSGLAKFISDANGLSPCRKLASTSRLPLLAFMPRSATNLAASGRAFRSGGHHP